MSAWRSALERLQAAGDNDEENEIVCEGRECWIGSVRIHRSTLNKLLRLLAVRDVSDVKGLERYTINSTGQQLLKHPALEHKIPRALADGGPFQIKNGEIVWMNEETP